MRSSLENRKYHAHLVSILCVFVVFVVLISQVRSGGQTSRRAEFERVAPFLNLPSLHLDNPLHKTLLRETLAVFQPGEPARNDSLTTLSQQYGAMDFAQLEALLRSGSGLTWAKFESLSKMFAVFILTYLIVMALTFYGVESLGTYRYIQDKRGQSALMVMLWHSLSIAAPLRERLKTIGMLLFRTGLSGLALMALFSPAYVLAYSFRSRFDTDTLFFMALLGTFSNGLLVTYAQKFFTFLTAEGRKGYVETAVVKNLHSDYQAFPLKQVLRIRKRFTGHVFQHIYLNARYQYLLTLKEQASFLITGLIIIEMALNIHGHLCYELLQNILNEQYDVALAILFGLFLIVKATEISVDLWKDRETRRYENRGTVNG